MTFLQEVARYIHKTESGELSKCCLVFPSRRAAVFFSKYLSEIIQRPIWSPAYYTISDLMFELSGYSRAEQVELLFSLYEVFRSEVNPNETFDDFYTLGEVLINDFDDVDKHMVNSADLFSNLSSLKDLDDHFEYLSDIQKDHIRSYWSHFEIPSSEQETFSNLWQELANLYDRFKEKLVCTGRVYEGLANRTVAERVNAGQAPEIRYSKFYIIGFNAFTPTEDALMIHIRNAGIATFFWDYDPSYVFDDPDHEAGYFLRNNLKRFPSPPGFKGSSGQMISGSHLEIISAPNDPGQVKMMSHSLLDLMAKKKIKKNNTAVVLSDEHLLSHVIHSIPEEYADINITMGYPLVHTPAFSLVQNLLDLQLRKKESGGTTQFYYKDVLKIIEHQYISGHVNEPLKTVIGQIRSGNQIFPAAQFLLANEISQIIFRPVNTVSGMIEYLGEVLMAALRENNEQEEPGYGRNDLQKEFIYHLYLTLHHLGDLDLENLPNFGLDILIRLLKKVLHGVTIPFLGEPLRGLQVMGVLETRVLDFENLIVLSANEGIFPKASAGLTIIPYNLRRGFGLPTPEHQDRLYAYYFYRLLHHARHVTFIYNTRTDGMKTGEMSRFLYQLKYLYGLPVQSRSLGMKVQHIPDHPIMVKKGEKEMRLLESYRSPGGWHLSPSALNAYLDCSLQFYFKYLAGIREREKVSDDLDQMVFGNLLHQSMEKLYHQVRQGEISMNYLEDLLANEFKIRDALEQALLQTWPGETDGSSSGRFLIMKEILVRYLKKILEFDRTMDSIKILGLEKSIRMSLETTTHSGISAVNIGGILDRVDKVGGTIRIIDYKTGSVEKNIPSIESLFKPGIADRNREGLQAFVYTWIYSRIWKESTPVKPGLYDVRKMYLDDFSPDFKIDKYAVTDLKPFYQEIETELTNVLSGIFDPGNAFIQVSEKKICERCVYKRICKRD